MWGVSRTATHVLMMHRNREQANHSGGPPETMVTNLVAQNDTRVHVLVVALEYRHLEEHVQAPKDETGGRGSKLNSWGYAGFSLCFHIPRCHIGYHLLCHSHVVPL